MNATWVNIAAAGAIGFLLGWLLFAARTRKSERAEEARLRSELASVREDRARIEADLASERRSADEKAAILRLAEEKLREAFEALSAEALRRNNRSFLDLANESLERFQKSAQEDLAGRQKAFGDLVAPVKTSLEQVDAKLKEIETDRRATYEALSVQVEAMTRTQERLRSETAGLSQALKSPSARGRWGEIQLRRVVELAGMLEHCDFVEQQNLPGDDRARPDLIVRLPGGKHLVVDAKVSLKAYLEAQDVEDDDARKLKLDEHARQVRAHVTTLGSRGYWDRFESSPDFVVMFMPGESVFAEAMRRDPMLLDNAVEQRVIPAGPTTLISLLKAAHYGWRQERLAENAQQVRDLGAELYDRVRVLTEHLAAVGMHLDRAMDSFDKAAGSYERRVLVAARRLKDLGAGTSKELPTLEPSGRTVRRMEAAGPEEPAPPIDAVVEET